MTPIGLADEVSCVDELERLASVRRALRSPLLSGKRWRAAASRTPRSPPRARFEHREDLVAQFRRDADVAHVEQPGGVVALGGHGPERSRIAQSRRLREQALAASGQLRAEQTRLSQRRSELAALESQQRLASREARTLEGKCLRHRAERISCKDAKAQSPKTSKERLWYLTSFIAPSRLCVKFVSFLRHLAF